MVQESERRQGGNEITFFVDDQPQTTDQGELKVREILEMAGARIEATDEPLLRELRGENEVEHRNLDETVRVENDVRFYTAGAKFEESSTQAEAESESREPAQMGSTSSGAGEPPRREPTGGQAARPTETRPTAGRPAQGQGRPDAPMGQPAQSPQRPASPSGPSTPPGGAQRGEAIEESKGENAQKRRGPEPNK